MERLLLVLMSLFFPFVCIAQERLVTLSVNVANKKCEYYVGTMLTNNSPELVMLDKGALPDVNNVFGLPLLVQKIGPRRELLEQIYGVQHADAIIAIRPGEEIRGSFSLSERFPNILSALSGSDLVLYWSYILKPISGLAEDISVGAIQLRRCVK